jgi:hypothetical protein
MPADVSVRHIWVNACLLTIGGLGAPKRAESRLSASRHVLHCTSEMGFGDKPEFKN